MKLRDERYLFHLTPWVFFPLCVAANVTLGWLLEDAPLWLDILMGAPIGWIMLFYSYRMVVRSPLLARLVRRRGSGTSRWGDGRPEERWR